MFGIDSIKLRVLDYKLSEQSALTLAPSPVDVPTGSFTDKLLYENGSYQLLGKIAYRNTDQYNLTLSERGLFVKFSVPKVAVGNNEVPVNIDLTRTAIQKVQEDLCSNFIKVDLQTATLSRLDLFRQEKMNNNFLDYVPVFAIMKGTRMHKRDYGTTFLFYNTQREVAFYDKDYERAISEGRKVNGSSNNVRAELRYLLRRPIKKTGYDIASDIFQNFEGLEKTYQEQMKAVIQDPGQIERSLLVQDGLFSEMEALKQASGRFGLREIKQHLMFYAVSNILEGVTFESYVQTVLQVSEHSNKRDLQNKLGRLFRKFQFGFSSKKIDIRKLYEDLYLKFVA